MVKSVLLVAHDVAPSKCFIQLAKALGKEGAKVYTALAFGGDSTWIANELRELKNTDFTFLGMSSSSKLAEIEIAAGTTAKEAGIPYGFYGDVFNCHKRAREHSWFHPLASDAVLYCGVNESDADNATKTFPNAQCIATGNPLREKWGHARTTRAEARAALGIPENKKVILVPGGKFTAGNLFRLAMIDTELFSNRYRHDTVVLFKPHPGESITSDSESNPYRTFSQHTSSQFGILQENAPGISDILPAVDVVVGFSGSIEMEAAYLGIPVIIIGPEADRVRHKKAQDNPHTEIEEMRYAVTAGTSTFFHHLDSALRGKGFVGVQKPDTVPVGDAITKIVAAIMKS